MIQMGTQYFVAGWGNLLPTRRSGPSAQPSPTQSVKEIAEDGNNNGSDSEDVEEAIEIALEQLGADRDQVEVDVISQGKGGILGFGAEPARIRVTLTSLPSNLPAVAKITVDTLLRSMKVSATATPRPQLEGEEDTIELDIEGEDSGLLIGRRARPSAPCSSRSICW